MSYFSLTAPKELSNIYFSKSSDIFPQTLYVRCPRPPSCPGWACSRWVRSPSDENVTLSLVPLGAAMFLPPGGLSPWSCDGWLMCLFEVVYAAGCFMNQPIWLFIVVSLLMLFPEFSHTGQEWKFLNRPRISHLLLAVIHLYNLLCSTICFTLFQPLSTPLWYFSLLVCFHFLSLFVLDCVFWVFSPFIFKTNTVNLLDAPCGPVRSPVWTPL